MKRVCYLALTVLALDGWCSSLASDQAWLETAGQTAITAAARTMANGTVVYVPQGSCKYEAFWLRDYVMMLEGKLVPQDKILDCAKVFFNAVSSEGYGVDCVKFDGTPIYKPGYGTMGTNPVLDGGPYTVKLAYESYQATKDPYFISAETLTLLGKVLAAIPHQSGGILPWINPAIQHDRCPFGFTDTVRKQGECLFSSLLELEARRNYAALLTAAGQTTAAAEVQATATAMASAIETTFWDNDLGLYRAATVKCREPDIWGSAYAVWLDVASSNHADRVAEYFEDHLEGLSQGGQIRHLPADCYWEESSAAHDTYQNGGYWGTASGWFAWTLARRNRPKALALLHELVADYQARGINEWVFGNRVECAQYLSSAALPLQAMRRLAAENVPLFNAVSPSRLNTLYVTDGLVAMWDGEHNVGLDRPHDANATVWSNCVDATKYALHWVSSDDCIWKDNASYFTGAGVWKYDSFPYDAEMGKTWTIEALVEPESSFIGNYHGICGYENLGAPTFGQSEDGLTCFRIYPTPTGGGTIKLSSGQFAVDEIQTVTFSDSPAQSVVYVNNVQQGVYDNSGDNPSGLCVAAPFIIGGCIEGRGDRSFRGKIYCVRIYNRVLSPAERQQNYDADTFRRIGTGVVQISGDPMEVQSPQISPAYGLYTGYAAGDSVVCTAPSPLEAVKVRNGTVTSNAQAIAANVYTNITGTVNFALMGTFNGTRVEFAHPGVVTKVVWMWELSPSVASGDAVGVESYVTNNLIAMWDGENNVGRGQHNSVASMWSNLISEGRDNYTAMDWNSGQTGALPAWKENSASFVNSHHVGHGLGGFGLFKVRDSSILQQATGANWTIEASARPTTYYFNNYAGICGSDLTSPYICQYENGNLVTRVYRGSSTPQYSDSGFAIPASNFRAGELLSVSFADSPTDMCFSTNGYLCATGVNASTEHSKYISGFGIGTGSGNIIQARFFDGDIYNVRIYSRYLTAAEVARNALVDRVRFDGLGGVRLLNGALQCRTSVRAFGPVSASVNGGSAVTDWEEWVEYDSTERSVSVVATTEMPRCVWRTTAGTIAGNALTANTSGPADVMLDAYDPSATDQLVVDAAAAAGTTNLVEISSLSGIASIHVGAVNGGAGTAALVLSGTMMIVAEGNGYAIVESPRGKIAKTKVTLFGGARFVALGEVKVGDFVLYGASVIELNGQDVRYHSEAHRNRAGWDFGARVVDSVGGGSFSYEADPSTGLVIIFQ